MIRFLGWLMLALGAVVAFGTYQTISLKHLKTLSVIFLPLFYLMSGFGLLKLKSWARYLIFALATFHILLGILVLKNVSVLAEFVPIRPLIEQIPYSVIRQNPFSPSTLLILSHFAFPILLVSYLSWRRIAVQFESWLQGNFSWGAPLLVILASGFVFSYALLNSDEVTRFLKLQERELFGFSSTPIQGLISHHIEFYLTLILALALISGGRVVWLLALLFALNYWWPFASGKVHPVGVPYFKFMFFGIGWILTALAAFVHWQFFWQQSAWLEARSRGGETRG